jgi:CubicO group peptidase (beta-lactamase class C family)
VAKPGKKFLYNNVMYLAAGMVAEKVSGKLWSDLVTTEFLKPLDMKHTRPNAIKLNQTNNLAFPHATIQG